LFRTYLQLTWLFFVVVWFVAIFNPGKGGFGLRIFSAAFVAASLYTLIRSFYGLKILVFDHGIVRRGQVWGSRWIAQEDVASITYKGENGWTGVHKTSLQMHLRDGETVGLLFASPDSAFRAGNAYIEGMHDYLQAWLEENPRS
jgi:hypothetical protein